MYCTTDKIIWLPARDYILRYRDADRFIGYCRSCPHYNTCWACPPFDFDADALLAGYRNVMIVATRLIRKHPFPAAGPTRADQACESMIRTERQRLDAALLKMEQRYPGSRSCFAGTCYLCSGRTCSRAEGQACRHPERVRPSLEALGFDLGRTCSELFHVDLAWGTAEHLPEYYTLVSGFFTNCDIEQAWQGPHTEPPFSSVTRP